MYIVHSAITYDSMSDKLSPRIYKIGSLVRVTDRKSSFSQALAMLYDRLRPESYL